MPQVVLFVLIFGIYSTINISFLIEIFKLRKAYPILAKTIDDFEEKERYSFYKYLK